MQLACFDQAGVAQQTFASNAAIIKNPTSEYVWFAAECNEANTTYMFLEPNTQINLVCRSSIALEPAQLIVGFRANADADFNWVSFQNNLHYQFAKNDDGDLYLDGSDPNALLPLLEAPQMRMSCDSESFSPASPYMTGIRIRNGSDGPVTIYRKDGFNRVFASTLQPDGLFQDPQTRVGTQYVVTYENGECSEVVRAPRSSYANKDIWIY